jgi:uncharacterized protein (DUF58 family)
MLPTPNPTRPASIDDLLQGKLIARLQQLDLASKKIFAGKMKGERRSKKRGESVEFADHRPYVRGDDLRFIDWNIFGRLDRLFLKLFLEEEDLALHILIDTSASLDCGEPSKFLFAQQAAAALGYVGLVNLNRVAVSAFGDQPIPPTDEQADAGASREGSGSSIVTTLRDLRGRRRVHDLGRFIAQLRPTGGSRFPEAAKRVALSRRGKGVMVVLSDFFMKEGYAQGLRYLVGRGYDVVLIQVLSPQELDPQLGGDLRLRDVEDGDLAEVTISAPLIKRYKQNLTAYCDELRMFCARREITHMTLPSDTPVETLMLDYLRARGVLR